MLTRGFSHLAVVIKQQRLPIKYCCFFDWGRGELKRCHVSTLVTALSTVLYETQGYISTGLEVGISACAIYNTYTPISLLHLFADNKSS